VAKRQEKKRQKSKPVSKPVQPPLPGIPPPEPPGTTRVFPMQLQVGDKLSDETGQWEVVGRPHTTGGEARRPTHACNEPTSPADGDENVGLLREGHGEPANQRISGLERGGRKTTHDPSIA